MSFSVCVVIHRRLFFFFSGPFVSSSSLSSSTGEKGHRDRPAAVFVLDTRSRGVLALICNKLQENGEWDGHQIVSLQKYTDLTNLWTGSEDGGWSVWVLEAFCYRERKLHNSLDHQRMYLVHTIQRRAELCQNLIEKIHKETARKH